MLTQPTGSSNNKELRGQQDYHDISPSHRDVEPLTQTADSETGTTESSVDSDYIPSDSLTSTDEEAEHSVGEETEHSGGEEETYQPVRLHATTSRLDDWLHRGPWLQSLPFFVYMHNVKRVRKTQASLGSKQASQRFVFDSH